MSKVDELLAVADERFSVAKMQAPKLFEGDPAARVLDCIENGGELVCIRAFKGAGHEYQPGEVLNFDPVYAQKLAKLGELGFVLPRAEYDRSLVAQGERKRFQNHIDPLRQRLMGMRGRLSVLAGEVEEAEIRAEAARVKYSDLQGQIAGAELELERLLEGPELQEA